MQKKIDDLLERLLKLTEKLAELDKEEDIDRIGEILDQRQVIIQQLQPLLPLPMDSEDRKVLMDRIVSENKLASEKINRLYQGLQDDIQSYDKKTQVLKNYYKSEYDLSSGQLFDRRR